MLSENRSFYLFFCNINPFYLFIYLFCLLALARTPGIYLNFSDGDRHPCLVPDLGKNLSVFQQYILILQWAFQRYTLSGWGKFLLFFICWVFLSWKFCQTFFPESIVIIMWSLSSVPIIWVFVILIDFSHVKPPLHSWDKPWLVPVYNTFYVFLDLLC